MKPEPVSSDGNSQLRVMQRAALYLRVSTARQAEHDVSIPDQTRQGEAYCEARGLQLVETFVEPGASAPNDPPPEFPRMIDRKSVGWGKSVAGRSNLGGARINTKKKHINV